MTQTLYLHDTNALRAYHMYPFYVHITNAHAVHVRSFSFQGAEHIETRTWVRVACVRAEPA